MGEPPSILLALYTDVTPLRALLQRHGLALPVSEEAPATVIKLLDSVIVADTVRRTPLPLSPVVSSRRASWESIGEVVDDAVRQLHCGCERDAWGRVKNVLARGFVLIDAPMPGGERVLRQKHDNAAADFFRRIAWSQLSNLLPVANPVQADPRAQYAHPARSSQFHDLLHTLLTSDTIAMFLRLPNECLWQVSGRPVDSELLTQKQQGSQRTLHHGDEPRSTLTRNVPPPISHAKSHAIILPRHGAPVRLATHPQLQVCRASIFHCSSFGRVAGLPHNHILRQLTRSSAPANCRERLASSLGPEIRTIRELAEIAQALEASHSSSSTAHVSSSAPVVIADAIPSNSARRLMRHIFLDACHLSDVMALNGAPVLNVAPAKSTDLPTSLKSSIPLFRDLLGRFQRTDIASLLRQHCPLPVAGAFGAQAAPTPLLSAPMAMQVPAPAVMSFVRAVVHAIVPPELLGDGPLHRAILTLIWRWVRAGSKDSIAIQDIQAFIEGSRGHLVVLDPERDTTAGAGSACPSSWRAQVQHASLFPNSGLRDGQERVLCWVLWLLLCLVSPLLVSHFYITTSETTGSDTIYFRKPIWARLTRQAIHDLIARLQLTPLDAAARARYRSEWELNSCAFVASVRVFPKRAGMRPIMNLSRTLTEEAITACNRSSAPTAKSSESVARADSWPSHRAAMRSTGFPSRSLSGASSASVQVRQLSSRSNSSHSRGQWADRPLNTILRPLLSVLQHEQKGQIRLTGSSISGLQGVHAALRRWTQLSASEPRSSSAAPVAAAAVVDTPVSAREVTSPSACDSASAPAPRPRLYVVSCDVQHAFDVMRQRVLLTIADRLLPPAVSQYSLSRYAHIDVSPAARRDIAVTSGSGPRSRAPSPLSPLELRVRWLTTVEREGDGSAGTSFSERVLALAARHRGAVFVDSVERSRVPRERLRKLLHSHLTRQAVLLPDKCVYSQHSGIPQGSVLSALLCNLYLGHMERHALLPAIAHELSQQGSSTHLVGAQAAGLKPTADDEGLNEPESTRADIVNRFQRPEATLVRSPLLAAAAHSPLIMRGMDDFICISGQRDFAVAFLRAFNRGFEEYACYPSAHKTAYNIADEKLPADSRSPVDAQCRVPWFGLSVDGGGRIAVDLSRICGRGVLGRGLVLRSEPPTAQYLRRQFFLALRPKCHALLLDCRLSTLAVIVVNLYQLALLACARVVLLLHHSLLWCGRGRARGDPFLVGSLDEMWQQCADICASLVLSACRQACNGCALHGKTSVSVASPATPSGVSSGAALPLCHNTTRSPGLRVLLGAYDWVDLQQVRSSWLAVTSSVPFASDSGLDTGNGQAFTHEPGCTCVQPPLHGSEVRAVFGHALTAVLASAHPAVREGSRGIADRLACSGMEHSVRAEVAVACGEAVRISAAAARALDLRSRR